MAKGRTPRTKSKPPPRPSQPGPLRRWWDALDPQRRRATVRRAVVGVLTAAAAVGAAVGLRQLRGYVMAQPPYAASVAGVVLADRPAWMDDAVAAEIRAELALTVGYAPSTFETDLAERVYAAAEQCPWIRRVHEVRVERGRTGPDDAGLSGGRIVVVADYRQPVAQAVGGGAERYIDAQGIVLPTDSARLQAMRWPMVRITGLAAPVPQIGAVWPGDDLTAGLHLVRLLAAKPYFNQITAVDVTNFRYRYTRGEPSIRLIATDGPTVTDIRFGDLPTGDLPAVGGPSVARRLGYLDGWYQGNGCRLAGPTYLDLRLPDRIGLPEAYVP
ncbi:MAG: hypothetical protein GX591_17450 [Planctomycetes bacterium]|nr:hypothetical protein [Planctomycetota bacterium]